MASENTAVLFSLHFNRFIENLSSLAPVFVFNLVESADGEDELNQMAPLPQCKASVGTKQ